MLAERQGLAVLGVVRGFDAVVRELALRIVRAKRHPAVEIKAAEVGFVRVAHGHGECRAGRGDFRLLEFLR